MIIISCSHGIHLAKKIASQVKKPYSALEVKKFPDGELYFRFHSKIKGKTVVLVQSFYGDISDCLVEIIFASFTAKDLGAKKVYLVAPYFPYLRQDKTFKPGECVSLKEIGKLIDDCVDKVYIVDPHLHRERTLTHVFKKPSVKLTANPLVADYIKKNIKNPLIIGPDWESYKWAEPIAKEVGCESVILQKRRISGRKVQIFLSKKIDLKNKNVILVDDMISTGNTILETVKNLKKIGAKKFNCFAIHGILVENALKKLNKAGVKVITTNTIPSKVAKIEVSNLISKNL